MNTAFLAVEFSRYTAFAFDQKMIFHLAFTGDSIGQFEVLEVLLFDESDIVVSHESEAHETAETGGYIYGRQGIRDAYTTGRGRLVLRARLRTEQIRAGREAIVVTELPYQVNKARLIADIAKQIREKILAGITDVRDESDRDGMRVVLELRRGENAEVIINQLFSHTQLQSTFGVILLALLPFVREPILLWTAGLSQAAAFAFLGWTLFSGVRVYHRSAVALAVEPP